MRCCLSRCGLLLFTFYLVGGDYDYRTEWPKGLRKRPLANYMVDTLGYAKTCFKYELYQETAEHYGLPVADIIRRNDDRELKEEPWHDGLSVRQMLIHVSDNVIKPRYGDDYFGVKLLERLREASADKVVVSDGGFDAEIVPLRQEYGSKLKVVRLVCDWAQYDETDSRGYVADYDVEVRLFKGMVEQGVRDIMLAVSE